MYVGNQMLMGTKDCAFLQLYEELFRLDYRRDLWFYNGGQLPNDALLMPYPGISYMSDEGCDQGIVRTKASSAAS